MQKLSHLFVATALVSFWATIAYPEETATRIECAKSAHFLAPPDSPDHRKYAPDREVEVLHLALDVTPNFQQRTVRGQATWQFKPILKPVRELKLDAVDLTLQSVTATEKIQGYQATDKEVIVTFAEPIPPGRETSLAITYQAEPMQGLYFRTPEMGYKEGDTHLFTQGESVEARHWYPCFDSPNEMFTSEITCRVPEGMTVISNGRLVSEEKDAATGLKSVHWSQEKPHANYLITLVAGYFKKLEDKAGNTPLAFYTPPSESQAASNSFHTTKDTMEFFNEEIGVPYPWPKYDQLCLNDFVAGGWVLHMLRSQLGAGLYRRCIKTYLERHQYGSAVTDDLRAVIEELSGRSYDRFFDQWVYHAHNPELEISYGWDEGTKLAKVSV